MEGALLKAFREKGHQAIGVRRKDTFAKKN